MSHLDRGRRVLIALFALSIGCSDTVEQADNPMLLPNSDCAGVEFVDHGQPLDAITIHVGDLGPAWLHVTTSDATFAVPTFERPDGAVFYAPVHPAGIRGGELVVQLTDGERVCPRRRFVVDALEPAPGATALVLERVRAQSDALLDSLGIDEAHAHQLVDLSEPGTIIVDDADEHAIAPLLFAALVDHPDNPQSISAVAEQDTDLLDALLKKSGMSEGASARPVLRATGGGVSALSAAPEINDAATLSRILTEHGRPACNQVGSGYDELTAAAGVLASYIPQPHVRGALGAFSTVGSSLILASKYVCATHPNKVTDMTTRPNRFDFPEDHTGKPLAVTLTAIPGPPLNIPANVAGLVLSALGAVGLADMNAAGALLDDLMRAAGEQVFTWSIETGTRAEEMVTIHADPWTVSVESTEWLLVVPQDQRADVADCERGICVVPKAAGDSSVKLGPAPEKFGSVQLAHTILATVNAIEVDLGPRVRIASPGFPVPLGYAVRNAVDPSLTFSSASAANIVNDETTARDGVVTVELPNDRASYPVSVIAESTSRTGARESGIPPRTGDVLFVLGDLEVGPNNRCIRPGATLQLRGSARYVDGTEATIAWSSPHVDDSGIFTAPGTEGEYDVVATATYATPGSPTFTDSLTVRVGDCRCWYDIQITGEDEFHRSGEFNFTITSSPISGGMVRKMIAIEGDIRATMSYVRPEGPTPQRANVVGNIGVVTLDHDITANSGSVQVITTPTGHFMAEFIGTVTNRDGGSSLAQFTVHGVGENEIASVSCTSASRYRPPTAQ